MVQLAAVKQNLYAFSPWLFTRIYRIYQSSPYAKFRNARIDRDVSEKLRARVEYESNIIKEYLNDDWRVRHGPFSGMQCASVSSGSLLSPKIIGSYESPIHCWIIDAITRNYNTILDIGCAEGYYAVGFALKSQDSKVYAYDTESLARENTAELAQLNGVSDRVPHTESVHDRRNESRGVGAYADLL
jgi:2-polyprenyl-3-methyl-5-hydroxy-6-metoxy-1,4-benzoquinol methylase